MSNYYPQQQPPIGAPPPQGYPKDSYPPAGYPVQGYPPPGYPPQQGYNQYSQPPRQDNGGCLEGCLAALCCCCLLDACF